MTNGSPREKTTPVKSDTKFERCDERLGYNHKKREQSYLLTSGEKGRRAEKTVSDSKAVKTRS